VEHRHHREHDVGFTESHAVGQGRRERVERERAMRVQDALGPAGGARGVAHDGGVTFVAVGKRPRVGPARNQLLVVNGPFDRLAIIGDDDERQRCDALADRRER
jgi:hypothetical protein